jgi:hypothetical protein
LAEDLTDHRGSSTRTLSLEKQVEIRAIQSVAVRIVRAQLADQACLELLDSCALAQLLEKPIRAIGGRLTGPADRESKSRCNAGRTGSRSNFHP